MTVIKAPRSADVNEAICRFPLSPTTDDTLLWTIVGLFRLRYTRCVVLVPRKVPSQGRRERRTQINKFSDYGQNSNVRSI
ncbi:unnamed protein product [Acanthoscelides obtectus]|uniref:Uncharacterized protein n=1 Tax=Acanthoscelides obtectus TaxID=200917 RepID=A0A9P0LFW3_ACAOB|nr:unnamed protein product [Acanthoscelides obtectus]CAK1635420.1 hypothetical protein AOBTE_LOCUS9264 [Acanthoscelides obtectus]